MTPVSESSSKPQGATAYQPASPQACPASVTQLPNPAIDLANRMFDLARRGDLTLLDYLAAGLPPNLTNNRGDGLLMLASYHGRTDLVQRMLSAHQSSPSAPSPHSGSRGWRGAPDPNQLNGRGQSIVAGAVFKGFDDVVRLLIEHGADPLAGQPSAEECAKMFNRWEGEAGFKTLFEHAPGRGVGGRQAAPPVPDREEMQRIPGVGLRQTSIDSPLTGQQPSTDERPPPFAAER